MITPRTAASVHLSKGLYSPPCRIRQLTSTCHKINYQTGYRVLPVVNHQDDTRTAYDGVVELYASLFADRLETQPFSRAMIGTFAELVRATGNPRAADVGCGPGHLTAMLHELGLDAFGLDLSPAWSTTPGRPIRRCASKRRGWNPCRSRTARSAACWRTTR